MVKNEFTVKKVKDSDNDEWTGCPSWSKPETQGDFQPSDSKHTPYLVPAESIISHLRDVDLRPVGFIALFVFEFILFLQLHKSYKHKQFAPSSIFTLI